MKGLLEGIWAGLLMGTVLGLAACAEVSPAHDQRSVMVLEFATADGREYVALEPVRMWLEEPLENVVLVEMRYVVSVEGQEYRATPPEVLAVWLDPVDAYMLDVGGAPRPSLVGQI
jgi:hypothetical protein